MSEFMTDGEVVKFLVPSGPVDPLLLITRLAQVPSGRLVAVRFENTLPDLELAHSVVPGTETETEDETAHLELPEIGLTILRSSRKTTSSEVEEGSVVVPRIGFNILRCLASTPNEVWGRESIIATVWDYKRAPNPHAVDVHVSNTNALLLEAGAEQKPIHTVKGVGFMLRTTSEMEK